jgi:hypothetical protein
LDSGALAQTIHDAAFWVWDQNWNEGLKSNLLAEAIGFVAGTIATTFFVDRLQKARLRTERAPVRKQILAVVDGALDRMGMRWTMMLTPVSDWPQDHHFMRPQFLELVRTPADKLVGKLETSSLETGVCRDLATAMKDSVQLVSLLLTSNAWLVEESTTIALAFVELQRHTDFIELTLEQDEITRTRKRTSHIVDPVDELLVETHLLNLVAFAKGVVESTLTIRDGLR